MNGDALHRRARRIGTCCLDSILSHGRRVVKILGALRPASTFLFCSETPHQGSRAPSALMSPAREQPRLGPELEMEDLLQSSNLSAAGCTKRWKAICQEHHGASSTASRCYTTRCSGQGTWTCMSPARGCSSSQSLLSSTGLSGYCSLWCHPHCRRSGLLGLP